MIFWVLLNHKSDGSVFIQLHIIVDVIIDKRRAVLSAAALFDNISNDYTNKSQVQHCADTEQHQPQVMYLNIAEIIAGEYLDRYFLNNYLRLRLAGRQLGDTAARITAS